MLVNTIVLKDTNTGEITNLKTNGVFISIGYIPHIEFAEQLGVTLSENKHIITNKNQKTNVDYLYAIGDVCVGLKQWVVAYSTSLSAAVPTPKPEGSEVMAVIISPQPPRTKGAFSS